MANKFAVALGSNMGDRLGFLNRGLAALDRLVGVSLERTSRVYDSAGWGREQLDPFLNAVLRGTTEESDPHAFLAKLRAIEDQLGRERTLRWGPRTLDLDLLHFGEHCSQTEELELPHPRIWQRPFVYQPLRDAMRGERGIWANGIPTADAIAIEGETWPLGKQPVGWGISLGKRSARITWKGLRRSEVSALGGLLGCILVAGDTVAFQGGLGAGKTLFSGGIVHCFGIRGPVQSPTFSLCKSYQAEFPTSGYSTPRPWLTIRHWDLYRLHTIDDLESSGFFSEEDDRRIQLVEWSERFPDLFEEAIHVRIDVASDTTRDIRIRMPMDRPIPTPLAKAFIRKQAQA